MLRKPIVILFILHLIIYFRLVLTEEYNLSGYPGLGYVIEINIGRPPQKLKVLVDTGSSTLAIASRSQPDISKYFHAENSSSITFNKQKIDAKYTQGQWTAQLAEDYVRFPSIDLKLDVKTDIGLITDSNDFFMNGSGWQGMVGLAYPAISAHGPNIAAKPWLNAVDKARGKQTSFKLKLCGIRGLRNTTHYGSFQLIDKSLTNKNKRKVFYTPILRERWFEIGILNIRIMKNSTIKSNKTHSRMELNKLNVSILDGTVCQKLNSARSIVDSGTTNIRLTKELLRPIVDEIKSAAWSPYTLVSDEFWYNGEAACWPDPQSWSLPRLAIDIVSDGMDNQYFTIELPSESYIRLVSSHPSSGDGGVWEYCYMLGLQEGASTILGVAAIEGLEVTFNRSSSQIAFQTTDCGPAVQITGPYNTTQNITQLCNLNRDLPNNEEEGIEAAKWVVVIVLTFGLCLVLYLIAPCVKRRVLSAFTSVPGHISMSRTTLANDDESQ